MAYRVQMNDVSKEREAHTGMLLSFLVSVRALRCPLYDGGVSIKARQMLAAGNFTGAFDEYRCLANLGSGAARCVIAYAYILGTKSISKNVDEAKTLAQSATNSEPGFSNYILGCIAMLEQNFPAAFTHFDVSGKSGFLPALSTTAKLMSQLYRKTDGDLRASEKVFWHAVRRGHIPGFLYLMAFYKSGARGFFKQLCGFSLLPVAVMGSYLSCRFAIFSMRTFFYHPTIPTLEK